MTSEINSNRRSGHMTARHMQFSAAAAASAFTPPPICRSRQSGKVIGIGRNPLREPAFSLNIDRRDGYEYYAPTSLRTRLLLELLDRRSRRSSSISPRRAKAPCRGSIPGASSKPIRWRLRAFRRIDEARLAGALHPDRHLGNVWSVDRAVTEDEPIKRRAPMRPRRSRSICICCRSRNI